MLHDDIGGEVSESGDEQTSKRKREDDLDAQKLERKRLKNARRNEQKKKAKEARRAEKGGNGQDNETLIDALSEISDKTDERTIHIGPIPAGMTRSDLISKLDLYGEVENVRIVSDWNVAFVHFVDVNGAMATKQAGKIVIGRHEVQVNPVIDPNRPLGQAEKRKPDERRKGNVNNLSDGRKKLGEATVHVSPVPKIIQTKADFHVELAMYGEVVHVHINEDRKYAYVHFADTDSAVALRGQVIDMGGEEVAFKAAGNGVNGRQVAEGVKMSAQYQDVVQRFLEDPSDPHDNLRSFFDGQLTQETLELVDILTSAATLKVMNRLAASTSNGDQLTIDRVLHLLDSAPHSQMESSDIENAADDMAMEAIAKYLKQNGGKATMERLGGKFKVTDGELKEWGFIFTPQSSGHFTVTAPDELLDGAGEGRNAGVMSGTDDKKAKHLEHYREVVQRLQEDSSDPHADLILFFDSQLSEKTAEFIKSLPAAEASKVMERLAALTKRGDKNGIHRVLQVLCSLYHDQVKSMNLGKSADVAVIEAIAKCIEETGGESDIGVIGSKFKVKKGELKQWGFVVTQRPGRDATVTAPDDLMDTCRRVASVGPVPVPPFSSSRAARRPLPPPPRPRSAPAQRTTRAAPRPSMAPHIAARGY